MRPWKKIDEKLVYDGFRKIISKRFILPDGRKESFEIVSDNSVVAILAFSSPQEVLLVRQFRPGTEKFYDELPAGALEEGETPLKAARRELLEETGYQGDLEFIGSIVDCAYRNTMRYCFLARECQKTQEIQCDRNGFR